MLKLIIEAMQCVLYQQKSQFTEKFQVALALGRNILMTSLSSLKEVKILRVIYI